MSNLIKESPKYHKAIVVALTNDFVVGFKAMLNSVLLHTPNFNETIICLDIGLTEYSRQECLKLYFNIHFVKPDLENYINLPSHLKPLKNAFYKLEIFKMAQDYDRLLFIDSDIIFIDSIQDLLDMSPKEELTICYHQVNGSYNSGLFVLNKLSDKIYPYAISLLNSTQHANLADQTIITELIKNNIITTNILSNKWNTTKRHIKNNQKKCYIGIHFVGAKPWNGGEKGYEEIEKIWLKYSL